MRNVVPHPMTVRELLRAASGHLAERGSDSPRLDAELLLARALATDRLALYLDHDRLVPEEVRATFREWVRRRSRGEPVAYILGTREFYELEFQVDRRCLIPRPETEHLVDAALEFLRGRQSAPGPGVRPRVADVATGSGCIAISVAHSHPPATVVATDLSPSALEVARNNAARLVPETAITFGEGELLDPLRGEPPFDLITCNPPYVTEADRGKLSPSVLEWEPGLALFSGSDPFAFHDRLLGEGFGLLRPGGQMVLELPGGELEQVAEWMSARHPEIRYRTARDLGGMARVLVAGLL